MIVFGLLCPKIPYCGSGNFSVNSSAENRI